ASVMARLPFSVQFASAREDEHDLARLRVTSTAHVPFAVCIIEDRALAALFDGFGAAGVWNCIGARAHRPASIAAFRAAICSSARFVISMRFSGTILASLFAGAAGGICDVTNDRVSLFGLVPIAPANCCAE